MWRGDLTEDFLHFTHLRGSYSYSEGLIHAEAYFRNFMVFKLKLHMIMLDAHD